MKYTQIPASLVSELQLNVGILCTGFTPGTGAVTGILGATTGGLSFADNPNYEDWGDDIDNCPKNTKEFLHVGEREVTISGTMLSVTPSIAKSLMGAADIDGTDTTKIVPRDTVKSTDFEDLWWVGDYSDVNSGSTAGFVAIKLVNAFNTGGFQLTTEDKAKGKFAFTYRAHYSASTPDVVPYEVYVKAGTT